LKEDRNGNRVGRGRESWKEASLFDTAMNRRVDSIAVGWYVQEVLEAPSVAVVCLRYDLTEHL
jgi:hypothetical protein